MKENEQRNDMAREPGRGLTARPAATPPSARLVLERLRVERQLRAQGVGYEVAGNELEVRADVARTVIRLKAAEHNAVTVGLRMTLGRALFAREARQLAANANNRSDSPVRLAASEDGEVSLHWAATFPGEVDAHQVWSALLETARRADEVHVALVEDCYLEGEERACARGAGQDDAKEVRR